MRDGGGIYNNAGAVMINDSTLSANSIPDYTTGEGSGIYNTNGTVTINHSTISDHTGRPVCIDNNSGSLIINDSTCSNNSSIDNLGGGCIRNNGTLTLNHSTLSNNSALFYFGGGIYNDNTGVLTISNSTLVGNSALLFGGGIYNAAGGTLTLDNSTLAGNSATNGSGGGIFNYTSGTLTLDNCTLAGNSASSGGGIYNSGTSTLNNCTLSGNSAGSGGGVFQNPSASGAFTFVNTIVTGNTAANGINIYGSFNVLAENSLASGDSLLAPLGNYGGPTPTMPPLPGSPAIDFGADSITNTLATDQRGFPRLSGAHVDIGAVELQTAPAGNPPLLMNAAVQAGGALSFSFTNVPDAEFTVLAATNVALPLSDWTSIGYASQNPPGQFQFTDPGATNYPQRFYRVKSP